MEVNRNRSFNWIPGAGMLYLYRMSADGGKTWTTQWMTESEAKEAADEMHMIVEEVDRGTDN